jgi:hypothetical protein
MTSISKFFAAGRGWLKCVLEWRRRMCSRNGSNDARRAQAKRLIVQQSYTGPFLAGYPYGEISSPQKTRRSMGV